MMIFIRTVTNISLLLPCLACAMPVTVKVKVIDEQQQPVANVDVRVAL